MDRGRIGQEDQMDPGSGGNDIQVIKLAGPGVPGMEYEAPVFHFDVPATRMQELEADPVAFLARLGLGPDQGVAPRGRMTVEVISPDEWAWNGRNWVYPEPVAAELTVLPPDGGTDAGSSHSCCYTSGPDRMTCHVHTTDPHTDTTFVDD
jgi:hypothetical protein